MSKHMDFSKVGTPKDFDEALRYALCFGPLSETPERAYHVFRDFLAQRFNAYMLMHPECEVVLKELFDSIVSRPLGDKPVTMEDWKNRK